jgi:hypothetical protein
MGVAYSANLSTWVAVGSAGATGGSTFVYSSDGMNWTASASGTAAMSSPSSVIYNANLGLFVAVGSSGTTNTVGTIAYSTDGITWTASSSASALAYAQLSDVATNPFPPAVNAVKFVAVGQGANNNNFMYSIDGMVWNSNSANPSFGGNSMGNGIAFGYSAPNTPLWVAVGSGTNTIMTSTDGMSWTAVSGSTSIFNPVSGGGYGVAYSMALSRWVAVGAGPNYNIAYSNNGTTWNTVQFSLGGSGFSVIYSETYSLWIACGSSIAYSPDGMNWTLSTSTLPFSAYVRGLGDSTPAQNILRLNTGSTQQALSMPINANTTNTAQFTYTTSIKSVPLYLNIPSMTFTGSGFTAGTTSVGLQVVVQTGSSTFVTTTFSTNQQWASGINIPLSNPAIKTVSNGMNSPVFTVTMGTQTPTPTPQDSPHLISGSAITCTFSITSTIASASVIIYASLNNGMQGTLYGYTYYIYPIMTPSALAVTSPITFVANKNVAFVNLTSTSPSSIGYATSNASIASIGYSNSTSAFVINPVTTGTITLTSNMSANAVYLANQLVSNAIYINNYAIPSGSIVPFFNKCSNIGVTVSANGPTMYITFTQNVTLTALNFANAITKGFAGTCGGFSNSNGAVYTLSLNLIPNLLLPAVQVAIGSITITTTLNPNGTYTAIASDANNANGSNDGTLLSIPFSSTGFVSPTYVSNFTVNGLTSANLTFYVGDTISIIISSNYNGNYVMTPLNNFGIVQSLPVSMGELVGALVTTANNPAPAINIIALSYPSSTTLTGTVNNVSSPQLTINGRNIVTGFAYAGINIGYINVPVTTSLIVIIYRNGSPVLQVWFDYTETSSSLKNLYIPFSYAGFANQPNPNIANLCFNQPQNPIYNNGDQFQITISFYTKSPDATVNSVVSYNCISGATLNNGAVGGVMGISLTVPTYTNIPSPTTPVVYTVANPITTSTILIPYPTSNSTGAYLIGSVSPNNGYISSTVTATNNGFNWVLGMSTGQSVSPITTCTITGYQASSPSYASGTVIYPTVDVINCLGWGLASNTWDYSYSSNSTFNLSSPETTNLLGFSFQYFNNMGLTIYASETCTMTIKVSNYTGETIISTTVITIIASSSGSVTLTYIPFAPIGSVNGYSRLPTGITSFTMTGQVTPYVGIGNTINIQMNGGTTRISPNGVMVGTLLTNLPFSFQTNAPYPSNWSFYAPAYYQLQGAYSPDMFNGNWVYVNNLQPGQNNTNNTTMNLNMSYTIQGQTITNGLIITGIVMNIQSSVSILNSGITFTIKYSPNSGGTYNGYNYTSNSITTSISFTTEATSNNMTIYVPFDMPLPGAPYSQQTSSTYGYYVSGVSGVGGNQQQPTFAYIPYNNYMSLQMSNSNVNIQYSTNNTGGTPAFQLYGSAF